jgi:aryl-alcohol dehydrogenase-like predicted oxidoreductase
VVSWSSQARGFFVRGDRSFTADAELTNSWYSDDNFERMQRAGAIAKEQGVTANNVALAYVLQQVFPTIALTGPANLDELRSTLPALGVRLRPEDRAWLNLESNSRSAASAS